MKNQILHKRREPKLANYQTLRDYIQPAVNYFGSPYNTQSIFDTQLKPKILKIESLTPQN